MSMNILAHLLFGSSSCSLGWWNTNAYTGGLRRSFASFLNVVAFERWCLFAGYLRSLSHKAMFFVTTLVSNNW